MDRRLRRGKHMPIPPPPRPEEESSDSDADSSVDVDAFSVKAVKGWGVPYRQPVVEDEDEEDSDTEEEDDEIEQEEDTQNLGEDDLMELGSDVDDFVPPPTPRVTRGTERNSPLHINDPSELGEKFSELIENCNSLDTGTAYDEKFLREMTKNIERGHELFEYLMKGTIEHTQQEYDPSGGKRRAAGPGDMYLAFLHAKVSSNLIRNRAEHIGSGTSIFTIEKYLANLKLHYVDEDGDYNPQLASANIAMESSRRSLTLNPLVAAVGAFDRETTGIPKVRKPRAERRRSEEEEEEEEGDEGDLEAAALFQQQANPGADNVAKEMKKILKNVCRDDQTAINLYEFTIDKSSFPKTVENMFYLSFLVKDGYASLVRDENQPHNDQALNVKPESKPEETTTPANEDDTRNQKVRHKYILSFSPTKWKAYCDMDPTGQSVIPLYQDHSSKE